MTFTIITATFNSEKTIVRTIDSVLRQSYSNFEFIIIDGNSKDGTVKILKSYENQFKKRGISFSWISEDDKGIYDAWNKGLNLAEGEWISFLGSDDYYLDNALISYYELIENNNLEIDWIYSNVLYVESSIKKRLLNAVWSWKKFRRNTSILPAHVGSFHNKKFFKAYGVYDTSYKIAGDYEMLLRPKDNLKTLKVDNTTAVMSSGGVSNMLIKEVFKETLRAKNITAGVSIVTCRYDYYLSMLKWRLKNLLRN